MPLVTRHSLITIAVLASATAIGLGIFIWAGIYNIGADDAHSRPVYSMLQVIRDRSIIKQSKALHPPPNLADLALIRQGAGNYDAMCTGCHLAPGMEATELSKGLYPSPPDFAQLGKGNPAHHFWVIKHGIKASGMPAWGKSMSDEYIWGMVAFLKRTPTLDADAYQALVASSGGHAHGGGETPAHEDGDAPGGHHADMAMPATVAPDAAAERIEHRHADGTVESHPTPRLEAETSHEH